MTSTPKHAILSTVSGKNYGRFKLVAVRYSDILAEHVYTAVPVDNAGNAIGVELNVVESCLAD